MNNNENKLSLNEKVQIILDKMEIVYKNDHRPWIIGYSGGKDSTTVVQLVYKMLQRLPKEERTKKVYIVSSDTLIENPIVQGFLKMNIRAINEAAKKLDLPVEAHIVYPDYKNSFWPNIIGKGLPTPTSTRFRWCTERLKIKPSNKFIEDKINKNGEVIVLLGVRKTASIARKIRIENRPIDGYLLRPHSTINSTYVYNPIMDLSTDDIWAILLGNNGISPWGGDNNKLFSLYMGSDGGECLFTITSNSKGEIDTPSCGNSRFGCWACTVVQKEKSLSGFIESGETWLEPLSEFRRWLLSIRNKHEYRMQYRRDGKHYYKKVYINSIPIDEEGNINEFSLCKDVNEKTFINLKFNYSLSHMSKDTALLTDKDKLYLELLPLEDGLNKIDLSKLQEDHKGKFINVLGYGTFTFEARQIILKRLLELQKHMQEVEGVEFDLITLEELKAIDNVWQDEEDISRNKLTNIYFEVFNKNLPWHDLLGH